MKKIILTAMALFVSSVAYSQSDIVLGWDISGLNVTSLTATEILLDADQGTRFAPAYGIMNFTTGLSSGVHGVCFVTATEVDAFCTLTLDQFTVTLDLDLATLNGDINAYDESGNLMDSGTVVYVAP